jgi:hypothetical protein
LYNDGSNEASTAPNAGPGGIDSRSTGNDTYPDTRTSLRHPYDKNGLGGLHQGKSTKDSKVNTTARMLWGRERSHPTTCVQL